MTDKSKTTSWNEIANKITSTGAKNVRVRGDALMGNDGLILTQNIKIAAGYVQTDWDALNCCQTR